MGLLFFRNLKSIFFIFLSVVMLNSTGFAIITTATSQFFVQTAKSGSCQPINGNPLYYTIKFKNVDPVIVYFSNKPTNQAKFITIKKFVKVWNNNKATGIFENNVTGLLKLSGGEFKDVFVFNVEDLIYNKKKNKITYKVRLIPITSKLANKDHLFKTRKMLPKKFKKSSLFIDNPSGSSDLFGNSWDGLGG